MGSRHHSRKKQQPLALNPPGFYKFAIDERVLCYEPDEKKARVLYDSKVLDVVEKKGKKGKSQVEYKIHFLGWNSSWDRYVAEDCVLKDTEENRELQRTLKSQADALLQTHLKKKKRKKTYSEIMKEATKVKTGKGSTPKVGKAEDSGKSSSSSDSSDADSSDEDDSISQVILTDRVKYILEQDFYNITKRNMLLRIPAEITVLGVLEAYVKYTGFKELRKLIEQRKPSNGFYFPSSKNTSTTETKSVRTRSKDQNKNDWKIDFGRVIRRVRQAQEIVYGLKTYFDFLLYQILLYDVENEQYKTYKKMIPKIPVVNCSALLPRLPDPNRPNESNVSRSEKVKRGRNNKKIPGPKRKPESNTLSTGSSGEPVAEVITKTGANKVKAVGRESRTCDKTPENNPESKCDKAKEVAVEPKSSQKAKTTRRNSKTSDKAKPVIPEPTPESIVEVQSKSLEKAKTVRRVSRTSEKATKAIEESKPEKSKETQRRSKSCEIAKGAIVESESLDKSKDVAQESDSCQKGKVHSNEAKSLEKAKEQASAQESAGAQSSSDKKPEKPKPTPSTSTRSQNATNISNNDLYVKKINQYMKELQAWQILPDECYTQDNTEPCMVYGLIHLLRLFIKLPDVLNRMQIPRRKVRVIVHHVNQLIDHIQTFYNFSTHRLYFTIPRCVYEEDLMGFGLPVSEQDRFPPPQPATTIDISQYSTKHHRSVVLNRSIPALGKVVEVTLTNPCGLNQEHQITVSNESAIAKHICDSIPDSDEEFEIITDETRIFPSSKRAVTNNSAEFMLEPIPCTSKSAFPGLTSQLNDKENSDKLISKKSSPSVTDLHASTNSSDEAVPNTSSPVTITEISDNKDLKCDLSIFPKSLKASTAGVSSKVTEKNIVEPSVSGPRRNSLRRNSLKSKPVTKGKQTSNEESVTIKVEPPDEPVIEISKKTGNNEARNSKSSTAKNVEHSSAKAVQPKKEIKKEKIARTPSPPPQPMVRQARKSAVNAAFKNAHILASEQNITARAISSSLGKTSPTSEMKARKRRASAGSSIKSTKRTKPPEQRKLSGSLEKAQDLPARSSRERTNSPSKATTSQQSQVKIETKPSVETPKPKTLPERRHSSPSRKSKEKANETLNKFNATIAALQRSPERQVVTRHSRTRTRRQ